jgi:hypothetical protein
MSGTSASRIKSRPQSAISSASRNQDRVAKKLSTAGVSDKLQRPSSAAASIRKDEIKLSLRMRVAGGVSRLEPLLLRLSPFATPGPRTAQNWIPENSLAPVRASDKSHLR